MPPSHTRHAKSSAQTVAHVRPKASLSPVKHAEFLLSHCILVLEQTLTFTHPVDGVLSHYFRNQRQLGQQVRACIAQTTYDVLRRKLLWEHLSRSAPKGSGGRIRRLALLAFAASPALRAALLSTLGAGEAAWLEACWALPTQELSIECQHNLPAWLAERLTAQWGHATMLAFAQASQEKAPLDVRVNILRDKRDKVLSRLRERAQQVQATPWSPWGLRFLQNVSLNQMPEWQDGLLEVQDEGSQLLAVLVDAKRGEMVVDFCAGAGGKTLALGAQMHSSGRLYAFDTAAQRLQALQPRLKRSGLSNIYPVVISHERDVRVRRLNGKIDRVLVDAPCSGLGTLRRNPDVKWRQSPASLAQLQVQQARILAAAAALLKPGGRLVYATCSVLQEENEQVAQAFDAAHPDFAALDVATLLPHASLAQRGYLHLWPHIHGTDGFFAAVWQRRQTSVTPN